MLFDIFLLVVFFLVYHVAGIFFATAVLVMGSLAVLLSSILLRQRLSMSTGITIILVLVFGSATLFFHNARFIQWKPTILYWLLGGFLWVMPIVFHQNPIRRLLEGVSQGSEPTLSLPDHVWTYINNSYAVFFLILGVINIMMVYLCSESTWVAFKIYGLLPITILFVILQAVCVYFYMRRLTVVRRRSEEKE